MAKSVKRNAKEKCFGQEIEIFREEMRTIGDMNAGIWIIFNHHDMVKSVKRNILAAKEKCFGQ